MSVSIQPFWGVSNLLPRNVCPIKFNNNFFLIYASSLSIIISKVNQRTNEIELAQLLNPIDSDNFEGSKYFENINSVELDENSGNLVFTLGNLIYIYKCEIIEEESKIKGDNEVGLVIFSDNENSGTGSKVQYNWTFECVIQCESIVTGATWFNNGNLLTTGEEVIIWKRQAKSYVKSASYKPASIVYLSSLSPDNHWFATIGKNDRLVKIWQVPDSKNSQFKPIPYSYLKHPRTVIEIRWKLNSKKYLNENSPEQLPVVCTWCLDGIFRIWSPVNPLQPSSFFLCGNINPSSFTTTESLTSPNQTHVEECGSVTKTSCMLSSDLHHSQQSFQSSPFHWVNSNVLKSLVEHELKLLATKQEQGVEMTHMDELHQQLLKDLLDREPDLLFRIQQDGSLTFWRVEHLGKLPYRTCKIFMMTRIPNAFSLNLSKESNGPGWVVDAFMGDSSAALTVYVHTIKGEITQFNMRLSDLLFPDQSGSQVTTQNIWSGQHGNTSILQGFNNGYQISISSDNDVGVFISDPEFDHAKLTKTFAFSIDHLKCFDLLNDLTFIFLDDRFIYLYIFPHKNTYEHLHLNKIPHTTSVSTIKVFDCKSPKFDKLIVGFDFKKNESHLWSYKHANQSVHELRYLGSDKIPFDTNDSFDWVPSFETKFDDIQLVDTIIAYSKNYQLKLWSVDINKVGSNCWTLKSVLDLSHYKLDNILIRVGYKGELALIPKDNSKFYTLTSDLNFLKFNIYNLIELESSGTEEGITDLAWGFSSTEDQFLAISFINKVFIYCLNNSEKELKWDKINELKLPEYVKEPISHLSFNTSGSLLISAGSQMFNLFVWKDSKWMIRELITQYPLNPLYNPELIFNLIAFGLNNIINLTLKHANQFFTQQYPDINESALIVPPLSYKYFVDLDSADSKPVSHTAEALFSSANTLWGSDDDTNTDPSTPPTMNQFNKLLDYLERYEVENLTKQQKLGLKQVVQLYRETKSDLSTYDNLGYYFYFVDKYSTQFKLDLPKPLAWAYASETQIQLLSSNLSNLTEEPSWEKLKLLGMHIWVQSDYQLSVELEKFCRNQFSIDREPSRCGLFYLAMKKRRLLLAMWKSSTHHKEQASMVKFLSNDFEEDRWKKAALKNAFVLISRQRYWDAVSFFLLGEALKDSINVCLKYLNDIDLALLICRLFEGIQSEMSQSIIKEHILPAAISSGDRNKIYVCYNLIEEPLLAVKSLILPLTELFPSYINEDNRLNMINSTPLPELYILLQSRKKGKVLIDIRDEVEGIVNSLSHYLKLGSPNLAIILLIKWKKLADSRLNESKESSDSLASQSAMIDSGQIDFDSWGWGSAPTPAASKASSTTLDKLSTDTIKLGEKTKDSDNRQSLHDLESILERISNQLAKEYITFQSHASRLLEDLDPLNWQNYQQTWQEGLINLKKVLNDEFFY